MKNHSKDKDTSAKKSKTVNNQSIDWFRNSTRYINSHRGCTFVIVIEGEAFNSPYFSELIQNYTGAYSNLISLSVLILISPLVGNFISLKIINYFIFK